MSYKDKVISIEQALNLVKSGDYIVSGTGANEAFLFFTNLHNAVPRVTDVMVSNCMPLRNYDYFMKDEYKEHFTTESWFYSDSLRKRFKAGNISYIPNHLHLGYSKRVFHKQPNIFVSAASMPDKHGYISLSLSNIMEKSMIRKADITILEINPKMPRTFGDLIVHYSEIDYLIEADYAPPIFPEGDFTENDRLIGNFIADYINDGDCLQLGIGGIPNAIAAALTNKKHLGIHTEMLTTGLARLAKMGVVDNSLKTLHNGLSVATFALGTEELYEYVDDNPSVAIFDGAYVNDPYVIGKNDNQVSINSTIEVDLTGQCCSESMGSTHFSGTGGQADTAIGAQNAKNGRSFIALYSTAMVKNPQTGEREEVSKIVPMLKQGAAVSLSRNDTDYVVTEYGVASLRGTSIKDRVKALINIAHPKFRDELLHQAKQCNIIV